MNEPMDIDLSLDEIIAKKRAQERVDNRTERRSQTTPYNRPPRAPRAFSRNENDDASPGGGQGQGLKNSLSFSDIKQRYTDPSFPSFSSAPLQPTTENLNRPCRELSVGLFTKDITPLQIRDLIQSTVGPVQELRLDSKGIAWVRMLRWQGWEVYSFLHGKVLDGSQRLEVRVYPLRKVPSGSLASQKGNRRRSG
ncbi:uncharacterized protein I303_104841 [Kwoniella dejecticola CBS 10117]|uniref:Uncharacterized protein n=1 Tax=Kwoniella dejecticola CBS 10117 TaxID=1296121 RepID=A0AAJ8KRI5_9TREE